MSQKFKNIGVQKKAALVTEDSEGLIEAFESIGARDFLASFRERGEEILEREEENLYDLREQLGISSTVSSEDLEPMDVVDKELFGQFMRLELAMEQLDSAIDFAEGVKCYMTPAGNFKELPNPIDHDFLEITADDIFVALCQGPTVGVSNIAHHYSNFYSNIHKILTFVCAENSYKIVPPRGEKFGILDDLKAYLPTQAKSVEIDTRPEDRIKEFHDVHSVLVDVPSFNDRHSVSMNNRENIFFKGNDEIRDSLGEEQGARLERALRSCCVDGAVTYTTQTMNHVQNELLVQSTVRRLLESEGILVRSAPLNLIAEAISGDIQCYDASRLGQLVIPDLGANFGPRYVCKLIVKRETDTFLKQYE